MAKQRWSQKCARMLELLFGLERPEIEDALARFGFDPAVRDEGWRLLRDVAGEAVPAVAEPDPDPLAALADWLATWLPAVRAVLGRHHPAAAARVVAGLARVRGGEAILAAECLLDRVDALDPAARHTLARHGLDPAARSAGRDLVRASKYRTVTGPGEREAALWEHRARAVDAMWRYYAQWSALARVAVPDRRRLAQLGLGRPGRRPGRRASA